MHASSNIVSFLTIATKTGTVSQTMQLLQNERAAARDRDRLVHGSTRISTVV